MIKFLIVRRGTREVERERERYRKGLVGGDEVLRLLQRLLQSQHVSKAKQV